MQRIVHGPGLADNFEVVLTLEQIAYASADDLMVVDKKDLQGHWNKDPFIGGVLFACGTRGGPAAASQAAGWCADDRLRSRPPQCPAHDHRNCGGVGRRNVRSTGCAR